MKMILMMAGASASLVAGSAFAGNAVTPLGVALGSSLPLAGAGVASIAAVALVAGIRMLRKKQDK